ERLLPAVDDLLDATGVTMNALGMVCCGGGPGSFTSLRIAAAIAKGIAFGRGLPLATRSSLTLTVAGTPGLRPGLYLSVLDAMRGQFFVAPVELLSLGEVRERGPIEILTSAELSQRLHASGALAIGSGQAIAGRPHARGFAGLRSARPTFATSEAGPEMVDVSSWEPDYGRQAEAQARWEADHGRPLSSA
ncbi:MAG: tRNA (adenosine(37)-N6)-threonylcarbamoyltransferase complex dimerization subunit type 1 TsaB, partial [Gemmatimonadaceae bacterium]